ncbi:SDR family oxidoreductase [Mesorhizobium sp. M1403]|uniref:SDR family oxidoreductase n=1 Tax=Mesorhizobium sp. M1403 TaxID=2957097 RepID=UPI00333A996D
MPSVPGPLIHPCSCRLTTSRLRRTRSCRGISIQYRRGASPTPKEIASLTVFLTSEQARHITGVAVPIDGGFTAG